MAARFIAFEIQINLDTVLAKAWVMANTIMVLALVAKQELAIRAFKLGSILIEVYSGLALVGLAAL